MALFALYLVPGIALASWVTRTPAIRDALALSTAGMGMLFFCLALGSMLGVLGGTPLVLRVGTRAAIAATLVLWVGGTFAIAAGTAAAEAWPVALGLAAFGLGLGCAEIAFNIDGADLERVQGRAVLPFLHGAFSLGTVIGGIVGIAFTAGGVSAPLQLTIAASIAAATGLIAVRSLPGGCGRRAPADTRQRRPPGKAWRDTRVWRIGAVVLALALAEGTANDWLPLVMVDGHGVDERVGSIVYTTFAAAMAAGRLSGPFVLRRVPRVALVMASCLLAGLGILGVVLAPGVAASFAAVVLWGLGAALAFPLCISAAAEGSPEGAAARVGAVAATGYVGFLAGPAALGALGEQIGIRSALLAVLALVAVAVTLSPALRAPSLAPAAVSSGPPAGGATG